jgi:hypothetical protein
MRKKILALLKDYWGFPVVVLIWAIFGFIPMWKYGYGETKAGVYGDSFGFVNSFFSSVAFVIATYTLFQQRREFHESKVTDEKTADILARQPEAIKKGTAAQAFLFVAETFQQDVARRARGIVLHDDFPKNIPSKDWSYTQRRAAEVACHHYDVGAILWKEGLIPVEYLWHWRRSILAVYEKSRPLIDEYRKSRDRFH